MSAAQVFDARPCDLGEGPLWHPERGQFYWFDIRGQRLLTVEDGTPRHWDFDEPATAAGWVDHDTLMVATASGLWRFDLRDGGRELISPLEADDPRTRSNDGRADPQGGFWIGTMKRDGHDVTGAIYRWYRGELRRLFAPIATPNAICFAPGGGHAYFTDTPTLIVRRVSLDADGWPDAEPEDWLDLRAEGHKPDGAVTDAEGNVWIAQWGSSRVACYASDGQFLRAVAVPAPHATCPAFGGPDLTTLYCTSARAGLDAAGLAAAPLSGQTFAIDGVAKGLPEPRVIL